MNHAHVVLADPGLKGQLPRIKGLEYVFEPARLPEDQRFLLLVPASRLEFNQNMLSEPTRSRVEICLVMLDTEPKYVQITSDGTGWEPPALLHPSMQVLQRVLRAWALEAEAELIATAGIRAGDLYVRDCRLREYKVPIRDIPPLRTLPGENLYDFEVSDSGSYLWWPKRDIHIGLDTVRYYTDPAHKAQVDKQKAEYDARYGRAIAMLRKQSGLRQTDIEGVTERQIRRIEQGESTPRAATLEKLAAAHGIPFSEYLETLAGLTNAG